jgi:hypothetical protein
MGRIMDESMVAAPEPAIDRCIGKVVVPVPVVSADSGNKRRYRFTLAHIPHPDSAFLGILELRTNPGGITFCSKQR